MLVKDLIELIAVCEVLIIIAKNPQESWEGKVADLPLKYMNQEISLILSTKVGYNSTGITIAIK